MNDFQEQLDSGYLFVPDGMHECDPLYIPDNAVIDGTGGGFLKFNNTPDGFCLINKNWRDSDKGNVNITIRNIGIIGPDSGEPSGPLKDKQFTQGIRLQKVDHFCIERVAIQKADFGIFGVGSSFGTVREVVVTQTGRDGIHFVAYDVFDKTVQDLTITQNYVQNTGDDCIAIHCGAENGRNKNLNNPPRNIVITNNMVGGHSKHENAQGRGIILTGVHDSVVCNNIINNTVSCGIWIQEDHHVQVTDKLQSTRVVVSNNSMSGVGTVEGMRKPKHAIFLRGIDDCDIIRNNSENHGDRYIRAERIGDSRITLGEVDVDVNRIEILK